MTNFKNPKLIIETSKVKENKVGWQSPSNLAIVKYWGKHGVQLPRNPSISFTLANAYTETILSYAPKKGADQGIELAFTFEGEENAPFREKVLRFLESLHEIFPFLRQINLTIDSKNSFPHSAGIASSASSMSALALCLCSMEHQLFGTLPNDEEFRRKASYVARLGSGSACRSIYATMGLWGAMGEVPDSSDLYAIPYEEELHQVFTNFHDDILIVSKGEKSVSSRAGHGLMDDNIYADNRYTQAKQRMHHLLGALRNGDIEQFGQIAESEALTLHALMMTSNPPYILMHPNSLVLIEKVRTYRKETGNPLYFSLDAGPNLHLLYPDTIKDAVKSFISNELIQYCEDDQWIADKVGKGPLQLQ